MAEGKTNMFGKTYNTIGSTDSNLVLKTKGDLKIQWGNKFIDLIKNGKIIQDNVDLLKTVSNIEQITENGIYLIQDTKEIWINIDGTKINLSNVSDTIYVSYLEDQQGITSDQKYNALKNIGFYYSSITEAKDANIKAGIIYVENEQKLYIVNNEKITEYQVSSSSVESGNVFSEIFIGQMEIYEEKGVSTIISPELSLIVNKRECLNIKSNITIKSDVNIRESYYIQSEGANSSKGFRLYTKNGKSVLEVDSVIERDSTNSGTILDEFTIYGESTNIISNAEYYSTNLIKCDLKYLNQFKSGQDVFISVNENLILNVGYYDNTIEIVCSNPAPELIQIQLTVNNSSKVIIEIQQGSYNGSIEIAESITSVGDYEVLKGPEYISFGDQYISKRVPTKFTISSVEDNSIFINGNQDLPSKIINSIVNTASEPYIKIENNNIKLVQEDKVCTNIGIVKDIENNIQQEQTIENPDVGIYSNNFIGLNSKLYDAIFKKKQSYPKYDESLQFPEDFGNEEYNQTVPNIGWIKELIKQAIPSGTITMFNGQSDIPEGWVVCDGTNGTPNLVGKFIKAVATKEEIGENNVLNENNEFTLTQEYLPKHSHPHNPHTHTFNLDNVSINIEESGDLNLAIQQPINVYSTEEKSLIQSISDESIVTESGTVNNIIGSEEQKLTITGGNHSHNATLSTTDNLETQESTSEEVPLEDLEWPNKPIKIEPNSYSLIFIMKL